LLEKLEHIPIKVRSREDIDGILDGLGAGEMDCWLDLRPFMQRTPFVLQGNASMARAYRLFRTMGLHHMFVGPPKPQAIGILTRKVNPRTY
jgi:chloride channel 7